MRPPAARVLRPASPRRRVWKSERKGKRARIAFEPFRKLTKAATKELETEAEALLRFVGPDPESYEVK